MNIRKNAFTCQRGSLTIRGSAYLPEGDRHPAVILSHGFGGTAADLDDYAMQMAGWGYAVFTYDFCGGSPRSTSDGAFHEMTIFTEQADLEVVMDYVTSLPEIDETDLTLMGCSQGGFISGLVAAARPQQVKQLVMFYPALCIPEDSRRGQMLMFSFDPKNVPEKIEAVMPEGVPFRMPPIGREYVTSVQKMDAFAAICTYPGPVLIVHGDGDVPVNVLNSRRAQAAYNSVVPLRCQLAELWGANHGFQGKENETAMALVKEFLDGRTCILQVDVMLTDFIKEDWDGITVLTLPFGGTVRTPYFTGMVQPGGADVQKWNGDRIIRLCADYILHGVDCAGKTCDIHVVNEDTGSGWKPTVTTDSEALSFLNGADCTAVLEHRSIGPIVRIFAKV